jgi:hypothetical protein
MVLSILSLPMLQVFAAAPEVESKLSAAAMSEGLHAQPAAINTPF